MKTLKTLMISAVVGLAATTALAAVTGSHHDLTAWDSTANKEVCLYCHGIADTLTIADSLYGKVGALCVSRCHAPAGANFAVEAKVQPNIPSYIDTTGTVVAARASVNAVNVGDAYAHGLTKADLRTHLGTGPVALGSSPAATANFAYVAGTGDMQCTSCHNVHSNTNSPFLNTNLFNGTGAAATSPSFCEDCHYAGAAATADNRGNNWAGAAPSATAGNPNGEHPVNLLLALGDVTRVSIATNPRQGRYIQIDNTGVFDSTSANGSALNTDKAGAQYTTGGKFGNWATAAANAKFGCYSCHSAHLPLTTGVATANPNLLLAAPVSSLDGSVSLLCVNCHGQVAGGTNDGNPGLSTKPYYHPAGTAAKARADAALGNIATYVNTNGTFTFSVDLTGIKTFGNQGTTTKMTNNSVGIDNATGKPRCTSCHDVHGGITNSMALADLDDPNVHDGAFVGTFCNNCHGGNNLPDVADGTNNGQTTAAGEQVTIAGLTGADAPTAVAGVHHRTRSATWCGATAADADTDALQMDPASWAGAAGTPGDCSDGLGCVDCHVFDGSVHSTAHNW